MTVQCLACDRFTLRGASLAKHGFGTCTGRPAWENYSATYPRECVRFVPAAEAKVEARRVWLAKRGDNPGA